MCILKQEINLEPKRIFLTKICCCCLIFFFSFFKWWSFKNVGNAKNVYHVYNMRLLHRIFLIVTTIIPFDVLGALVWFITKFHRYFCLLMPVLLLCNAQTIRFSCWMVYYIYINYSVYLVCPLHCCLVLIPFGILKCALNTSLTAVCQFHIQTKCLESSFAE